MSRSRKTNTKEALNTVPEKIKIAGISPYNEEANMEFSYMVSAGSMIANEFTTSDDGYSSLLNNYLKNDVNVNAIKDCLENLFAACEMVKDNSSSIDNLRIADKMYLDFIQSLQVTIETSLINIRYGLLNRVKEVLLDSYPGIILPSEYNDQSVLKNINYTLTTNNQVSSYIFDKDRSFRENNDRTTSYVNLSDIETQNIYLKISKIIALILNTNSNIVDPYALQTVLTNLHVDFIVYQNSIVNLINWIDKIYDIIYSNTDICNFINIRRKNSRNMNDYPTF